MVKLLSFKGKGKDVPVYLMVLFYTLVFSYATVTRYYSLRTYAYDLGNYNQALYTTLKGYGLLYYTADLPVTNGSMMGVHFCPILIIILPVYALYPAPPTLLILKSFVLALGALPVCWLADYLLKKRFWGILFSGVYLLNPMLQGINWFDFHPEAFFPTFCLFSLHYGLKGDWLKYVLFCILSLTTTEYSSILILVQSIYLLWFHKEDIKRSLQAWRHLEVRNIGARLRYPLLTAILAVAWLFISLQVISIFSPANPMVKGGAPQWSILGAEGTLNIPLKMIASPQRAFVALMYEWPLKLTYILILFGSTAFLSFLGPKSLILTLPWLMAALLSNYSPFYFIGNQYPAFLLPSVMVGSVVGTRRLLEFYPKKRTKFDVQKTFASFLLITALISSILCSPLYGLHLGNWTALTYGVSRITEHDTIVMQISSLIPSNARVITQQNIFPLLSSRTDSFVIPIGSFYPPGPDFNTTLIEWLQQSDFVLVDLKTSPIETYLIYNKTYAYINDFGVYAYNDGVILLKNGYVGEPVWFEPYKTRLNWKNLTLVRGEIVEDPDSKSDSQKVLRHPAYIGPMNERPWYFFRGPGTHLPPGEYEATFKLKVRAKLHSRLHSNVATTPVHGYPFQLIVEETGNKSTGRKFFFNFSYSDSPVVYASRKLCGSDFPELHSYQEFKLTFSLNLPAALEFATTDVSSNIELLLDWVEVTQLRALP